MGLFIPPAIKQLLHILNWNITKKDAVEFCLFCFAVEQDLRFPEQGLDPNHGSKIANLPVLTMDHQGIPMLCSYIQYHLEPWLVVLVMLITWS